jgi:MoaA/NifB/PqqE/SkfB family radical SAM enzyme
MALWDSGKRYLPMKTEIGDKSLMMIILLEKCNFTCAHCIREDYLNPGYKLSFEQFRTCLSDCRSLNSIRWVHFTGGEPTLWKERNRHLIDLLLEISKAGFTPGFTSNGSFFVDLRRCRDFFAKYVDGSSMPLRVYLSIDTFHKNFDPAKERARSLDNILKCKQELPREQADLLEVNAMAVVSKDFSSLLPDGMARHYESLGVAFSFLPLVLGGRANSFSHLCPDLDSDNPEDLGAYQLFHRKKGQAISSEAENRRRGSFMNLIGDNYYFANPWRKVARLGNLPEAIVRAYAGANDA